MLAIAVIPVVTIVGLLLLRRPWAALYYASATILATLIVQLVKNIVGRPRPLDILVAADPGSFPSGHSANAAVMAATFAIIFPRVWVWVAGAVYTVGMMLSRTYLGAHWISDTIGGLLIALGIAIIIWAPLASRLQRERERPHPPIWQRVSSETA
ncbi:phosphatase PAP2 family protein [Gulosibacter sediminis]|uniref:phosphatase PAP2 family protein n=1 Tax=Gulosibacter sediminis TaxID=1729695 RepID=UPI002E2D30B7|nr:phosphatase PAP2 family protein [Gulosibacter sediminis]